MKRLIPLVALAAMTLVSACSHHGARSFSIQNPTPTDPPPAEPPSPPPPAPPPQEGVLSRTSGEVTGIVGGVLHVAGNTALGLGNALGDKGVSGIPIVGGTAANVVQGVDTHLNGVAQVEVVNLPVLGASTPSGNQAIGVNALSQTPSTGTVVTVGALNQGAQQPVNVSLGGTQLLGTPAPGAVNVGLLNGGPASGGSNPLGATNVVTTTIATVTTPVIAIVKHP